MAGFQTNVFRDGHWRTETVSTQQALDATAKFDASRTPDVQASPPQCGILTRTIVPSPVAHWILPIRIRSRSQIDVAFVGSHSVQISELRSDGQLIDIVRKDDFGSRICNAVVMGDTPNTPSDIVGGDHASAKLEDAIGSYADFSQPTSGKARQLPPQILVLFLTNGQLAFVFLTTSDESWGFEIMQYRTPWAIKNLGFRVAIDPSSRYLAAASSQKAFMIWQLESRENLEEQYKRHGIFNPLKTDGNGGEPRTFQGTLFHLEFLFPRPEDVDHIILMMVVARRDSHTGVAASRVITLDWLAGEDLRTTMQGDMNGIRLPDHYQMPLMIIPIRFKNSMCVVAEHSIGVIRNAISGSMTCDDLLTERPPKTSLYHGLDEPLWCAWARPIRGDWYCKTTDVIILAREDGYLVHIEVDAENVVPSVTSAGCLDSTISTAFAMPYIDDADAIIVGGDSSPGGTWKLSPRTDPVRASTLRNWSPVVDITNAPFDPPRILGRPSMAPSPRLQTEALVSASGRGLYGNLASFRRGRQARIGTDIDTDSVVRQVGAYMASHRGARLLHVALSLPESTLVLQFSSDMTEVRALDDEDTNFDLNSRTLRVHNSPDQTVQVTETHITLIVGHGSYNHSLQFQGIARADHATCSAEHVALCSETTQGSLIHSYSIGPGGIISIGSWEVKGEVTCLLFKPDSANHPAAIIVASILEGRPWISMYDVNGRVVISQTVTVAESPFTQQEASDENALFETITGLQIPAMTEDIVDVILGTVWGRLITVRFSLTDGAMSIQHVRKLGKSPVKLFVPTNDAVSPDLLATCDEHAIMLAGYCPLSRKHKRDAMVIPTSDDNTAADVPPVEWISALPPELQIGGGLTPLLLLAGSRLLLAELSNTSKLIPRCLPVEGTPTKVVYTDIWKCFIVGMIQDNRPTIDFIDALTGEVISQPTSAARGPMTYAAGLGGDGDRIMCMDIWQFHKDGQLFPYILVGLQGGNLLTLSARDVDVDAGSRATGKSRVIQYWMRYKRKGNPGQPVYSVHGVEDGMIHCTGTTLHYEVLNPQQKRMIDVSHFELDSPALTLQVREGKLFVLTSRHSLLILDHCNPSTGPDRGRMPLLHADSATRSTIHMVPMRVPVPTNANATITMLADASSNVVGVWTAVGGKHQQIETVFRASLPVPIRRFVQARCRMPWFEQREQGKYGTVRSPTEDLDTFGVALDGALYHFTIIEAELWEMLNFVQDCAEKGRSLTILHSKDANGDELESTRRHINGDMLSRSLESGVLEDILTDSDLRSSLFALLDKIDAGRLTEGFREDARAGERYHDLAYRILEYLDAPVL